MRLLRQTLIVCLLFASACGTDDEVIPTDGADTAETADGAAGAPDGETPEDTPETPDDTTPGDAATDSDPALPDAPDDTDDDAAPDAPGDTDDDAAPDAPGDTPADAPSEVGEDAAGDTEDDTSDAESETGDTAADLPPDFSHLDECDLECPDGTHNPTDVDGCVHSCRCVPDGSDCAAEECGPAPGCATIACPDGSTGGCTGFCLRNPAGVCAWEHRECPVTGLHRWATCGDPVCSGHTDGGTPPCTTETVGETCSEDGELCDPIDGCNSLILCAAVDPRAGGCPISRRSFKQDIEYLDDEARAQLARDLLSWRLATWRYVAAPEREHLGVIIDDIEPSPAVDSQRDQVDLYGYVSMTVATLQAQAAEIAELRRQIEAMQERLYTACE